eukprot:symbB.v1.2.023305.t1/scaffold2122.1/size88593/4
MKDVPTELEWPQIFATSWKMNPRTFAIFRAILASVIVGHQVAHVWNYRDLGWFYLIYFTHWTMILAAFSECLLFYLAVSGLWQLEKLPPSPSKKRSPGARPSAKFVQITRILWHIVQPFSLIGLSLFWSSWLLQNSLEELPSWGYLDFYTHGFVLFWLLLSFLLSNVPFKTSLAFGCCVTYSWIYFAWTWVHFYAKIGTPAPCDGYQQHDCPIYNEFDWHKPHVTALVEIYVCLIACPVVCLLYRTLATCRGKRGQELTMPPDPEIADSNPPTEEEDVDTYQDKQPADHAKDKEKLASIEEADEEGGDQEDDLKDDAVEVAV